jgi:hypothetical protein
VLHRIKTWLAVPAVMVGVIWVYPQIGVADGAHVARSRKVDMHDHANVPSGTKLSGTVSGTPFGRCPYTGVLRIPSASQVWRCRGGTITFVSTATTGGANNSAGNWTMPHGTGKYAHIHGRGTYTGTISKFTYRYVGSASY